jgi:predicted nucleic acid-binding protein
MYLADTSLWIDHFRGSTSELLQPLAEGQIVIHDFILGELHLGHFKSQHKKLIFERLNVLEKISLSANSQVIEFAIQKKLSGTGIGWIDCHLLHACMQAKVQILTKDKNLKRLALKYL